MNLDEALEEIGLLLDELKLAHAHIALAESFIPEESWEDYEEMYWK